MTSPLVLDLDNDGIELSQLNNTGSVYWDGDNDGFREASGWVKADDGLLVRDVNANGTIDNNSELFGNTSTYANGFANLASLDSNHDGKISSADTNFSQLKVWQDTNQDGVSQAGEIHTLSSLGITEISLTYSSSSTTIAGNDIKQTGTFVQGGVTKTIVDAWFATDQVNSEYDSSYTLDAETLYLPTLRGYGDLPDLHIAMSLDSDLKDMMADFVDNDVATLLDPTSGAYADFKAILYKWAGVDGVTAGSRGTYIDAKDLGFYEKLMGQSFIQTGNGNTPNPGEPAANSLNEGLAILFDNLYARILFQAGGSDFFTVKPSYNPVTDAFEGTGVTLNLTAIGDAFGGSSSLKTWELAKQWLTTFSMLDKAFDLAGLSSGDKADLATLVASTDATGHITYDGLSAAVNATSAITSGTSGADIIIRDEEYLSSLHGNDGNDIIFGNYRGENLYGDNGNDIILGYAGNDALYGGAGNDTLIGGTGADTLSGGANDDTYIVAADGSFDTISENGSGTDTLVINGSYTTGQITTVRTTPGVNTNWSMDVLANGVKVAQIDDQFNSSSYSIETIRLDNGSTIDLSSIQYTTNGTSSADTIYGIKTGANPDDIINGLGGNDSIYGYDGNDRINGGAGADTVYGGAGNDTYVIASGEGGDTINEQHLDGFDTIEFTGSGLTEANMTLAKSGTNLTISFSGTLYATVYDMYYSTGSELEMIKFSDGSTKDLSAMVYSMTGTASGDTLNAAAGNFIDEIHGLAGADVIRGYAGNDVLYGDDGNDTIYGGDNNDTIYGGNDNDTLYGELGNDRINGGMGTDSLYGAQGDDTYVVVSGEGKDTIYESGYGGTDTIEFSGNAAWVEANFSAVQSGNNISLRFSGTEVAIINTGFQPGYEIENIKFDDNTVLNFAEYGWAYTGTASADNVSFFPGHINNIASMLGGNDTVHSYAGNDVVYGGDGNDTLYGGDDNDLLYGDLGTDILYGENGNDTLYGGAGTDTMTGGAGADKFMFDTNTLGSTDTVADFNTSQGDILDISGIIVGSHPDQSAIDDFVTFSTSGGNTTVSVDRDGTGGTYTAQAIATLTGVTGLDASDMMNNGNMIA